MPGRVSHKPSRWPETSRRCFTDLVFSIVLLFESTGASLEMTPTTTIAQSDVACPEHCRCLLPQRHTSCLDARLSEVPQNVPSNTSQLDLQGNQLRTLPTNAFENLSVLKSLHLIDCELSIVKPGAFNGLSQLTYLYLQNNSLKSLPIGLFDGLVSVTYLYLDYNQLDSICSGIFSPMKKLTGLYIRYNHLTWLADHTFQGLTSLQWLYLSDNSVSNISKDAFHGLQALRRLTLDGNNLTTPPSNAIRVLDNLNLLRLSRNPVPSLKNNWLARGVRSLTHLNLDEMGLTSLGVRAFARLRRLRVLTLRNNRLTSLRSILSLKSLATVGLSGNPWLCDCRLIELWTWLVSRAYGTPGEVICRNPPALKGTYLALTKLQILTCPAFENETAATEISHFNEASTLHQTTGGPRATVTSRTQGWKSINHTTSQRLWRLTLPTLPAHTTDVHASAVYAISLHSSSQNKCMRTEAVETLEPCRSSEIQHVRVDVYPRSVKLEWESLSPDPWAAFQVYVTEGEKHTNMEVQRGLTHLEVSNLIPATMYTLCIIPFSDQIRKCLYPASSQCQTVFTDREYSHFPNAAAALLGLLLFFLLVLTLVLCRRRCLHAVQFQRHFDEDSLTMEHSAVHSPDVEVIGEEYTVRMEDSKNVFTQVDKASVFK
ncbi:uncharacterized protein LOC116957317 isoform X1 [Petromyzon marinus]|uniref:uncharacterized protein LOC116957317 isoform X1 n=1 Tax=Petromyzon marinus TaxID=7757 RepID=UPI003F6F4874